MASVFCHYSDCHNLAEFFCCDEIICEHHIPLHIRYKKNHSIKVLWETLTQQEINYLNCSFPLLEATMLIKLDRIENTYRKTEERYLKCIQELQNQHSRRKEKLIDLATGIQNLFGSILSTRSLSNYLPNKTTKSLEGLRKSGSLRDKER